MECAFGKHVLQQYPLLVVVMSLVITIKVSVALKRIGNNYTSRKYSNHSEHSKDDGVGVVSNH